jgi:hypothetical protein
MKSKVIELQEKANQLLELAIAMDERVESAERFEQDYKKELPLLSERWAHRADTRKRGSRRLWNAYLQVLTQIKLEL